MAASGGGEGGEVASPFLDFGGYGGPRFGAVAVHGAGEEKLFPCSPCLFLGKDVVVFGLSH